MSRGFLHSRRLYAAVNPSVALKFSLCAGMLVVSNRNAWANEVTWSGGAGGSWDWVQPANWAGGAIPEINNNSIIHFAGPATSTGGNNYDNLGYYNSFNQILFDAGAASFYVQGDFFILAPNGSIPSAIINNSSNGQNFYNAGYTFKAGTDINPVSGDIQIGPSTSPIYIDSNSFGSSLFFDGGNGHKVTINAQVNDGSGTNGQLTLQANDVVSLANSNTYSGGTIVNAGVVEVQNNNAVGIGPVTVATGGIVSLQDTTTISNPVTLNGGTIGWHYQTALPGAFSGPITLNSPGGTVLLSNYYGFGAANGLITGAISGSGALTVTGTGPAGTYTGGTLTLSGSNSYTGGTVVAGGTLALTSATAFPTGTSLNVSSGAAVTLFNHGTGSTYVPVINGLSNTGTIDISNDALISQNGSISDINAQVARAYQNGTWTGTSTTAGVITSSIAAADTSHLTAIGVATGLSSFEGVTVSPSDVLVKYTYNGDANLDGKVDASDYSRIDFGFTTGATGWQNGDFNYDGVVNGSDYTLIDNSFNTQGAVLAAESATATAQVAAVPEPATLGLLAFGALGLIGRRRRTR